ncbi:MAG: NAD(P)-binding protein [Luteitalea sp.]|nr:NAD(P)-binding protein [Luteitalea sp.]
MEDRNMDASTSVLIVGGSLNGLTMAMLLARRRVPCLVLERHPQTFIQYKSRGDLRLPLPGRRIRRRRPEWHRRPLRRSPQPVRPARFPRATSRRHTRRSTSFNDRPLR